MDKVQKHYSFKYNTPSLEPFRIDSLTLFSWNITKYDDNKAMLHDVMCAVSLSSQYHCHVLKTMKMLIKILLESLHFTTLVHNSVHIMWNNIFKTYFFTFVAKQKH
jgi:hypothetical protein